MKPLGTVPSDNVRRAVSITPASSPCLLRRLRSASRTEAHIRDLQGVCPLQEGWRGKGSGAQQTGGQGLSTPGRWGRRRVVCHCLWHGGWCLG